jgi:hypothetical protein
MTVGKARELTFQVREVKMRNHIGNHCIAVGRALIHNV